MSLIISCDKCKETQPKAWHSPDTAPDGWVAMTLQGNGRLKDAKNSKVFNVHRTLQLCPTCIEKHFADWRTVDYSSAGERFKTLLWDMIEEAVDERLSQ